MVLVFCFWVESQPSPSQSRANEVGAMKLSALHKKFMKDPQYRKEYDALEAEFALMAEVINARQRSGLNHPQLVRRMKTTRRTMTRLENGRDVSIETLSRFAKATGHRLKITFEPVKGKKSGRGR